MTCIFLNIRYNSCMRIVLLRHGENKKGKLTSLGKRQIIMTAKQLKKFNFSLVFSSPVQRCVQSAKIVCKVLKLNFQVEENLKERWQLTHEPQTKEEIDWWNNYMNYDFQSLLKEDCRRFMDRNFEVFKKIQAQSKKDDDVLVVAHSATSYALLNYVLNKKSKLVWQSIGLGQYICYEL